MARLVFLCALSSLVGCGARSGLEGDGRRDLGPDEGTPPGDFGPDASSDDLGCEASGPEVCDGLDQDCDGRVDEGTLSECRDCRPGCTILELPGELGAPWLEVAEVAEGVEAGRDGALRLAEDDRTEAAFAWVANTEFGTLTKLDLETGRQLGEFDSVLRDGSNRARPPLERCDQDRSRGNCPSRTAVDLRGGVFVANRAFGNQGTVTRIAGQLDDCRDRDGDGRIETSADLDGDGIIERSVPGEYLGQDDECLLWTVDVGAFGGLPRAVAIDAEGEVWVGLYEGREVVELDPDDGDVLRSVPLRGGFTPYGAAVDSAGTLWLTTAATGQIAGVDTREGTQFRDTIIPEVVSRDVDCRGNYGIAIDGRDHVWLAGFQCAAAFRYVPEVDRWDAVALPSSGATRGIAADDRGFVWIGSSHTFIRFRGDGTLDVGEPIARLTRIDVDDLTDVRIFGVPGAELPGLGTVGVGLDPERRVWMVNQDSGTVTRFDPETGAVDELPVGDTPYTYSDFTGFALRTFTAPSGFVRAVLDACPSGMGRWERLTWDADVPGGTRLEVRVRSAFTRDALGSAPWFGPFDAQPADLEAVPLGRFLEVETTLVSDGGSRSPSVRSVSVQVDCAI